MRAALLFPVIASLLITTNVAHAQPQGDTPSLLPLPRFSPPPLPPLGPRPVAVQARAANRPGTIAPTTVQPFSIASRFAQDDLPAPGDVPGRPAWEHPSEAIPSPAQGAVYGPPVYGPPQTPGCGECTMCPSCQGGQVLGGSPFAQALNTGGIPPLNVWGMRFSPGLWFGSLAGLVMTRDGANALSTTYNSSNVNTNLLDTGQAKMNWAGGGQVMFGRWFGPQTWGTAFVYWGLGPMTGSANVIDPNYQLSTPFNLGNVNIGQHSATFYFDNAHEHALWRKDGFNNFEWNALRRIVLGRCAPRVMFTGLAGVRYFRFQDGLIFGGVNADNFSDAGGAYAAYLNTGVTNNLVGFQLGTRIDYFVLPRVRLYAMPIIGFFGNEVSMREHLYSGDGAQGFDVFAKRSTVSTLGQLDLGAGYQITPRFALFAAYRLIGVTRVGLADNQIPAFWADQQGMQHIKTNGDLILHGVMMGGMWNF